RALLLSSCASAITELYPLSLHDALPISAALRHLHHLQPRFQLLDIHLQLGFGGHHRFELFLSRRERRAASVKDLTQMVGGFLFRDRKSTRLNSSHVKISYAVFCLKKKK